MEKRLSEQMRVMEEMGVDTSSFTVFFNGNFFCGNKELAPKAGIQSTPIEDVQLNHDTFRRWITAQTFKMMSYESFDGQEKGWDACLRITYSYEYQFKMMLDELKTLNKLYLTDKEELEIRKTFFNTNVVIKTCEHYINMIYKYGVHEDRDKEYVYVSGYGRCELDNLSKVLINKLEDIIVDMRECDESDFAELRGLLNKFIRNMKVKLPFETPKCSAWKEAFKGAGAYYTLKNLILFHNVMIPVHVEFDDYEGDDFLNKRASIKRLDDLRREYSFEGNVWKLHYLMKDVIVKNKFSLESFKEKYAKRR